MSDPVAHETLRSQHSAVDTLLPGKEKMQGTVSGVQNLAERVVVLRCFYWGHQE